MSEVMHINPIKNQEISTCRDLHIHSTPTGFEATIVGRTYPCVVGQMGLIASENKTEGDKCTSIGRFPLRRLFYRPDVYNNEELSCALPTQAIHPHDGWCDESAHTAYNTLVDLRTFNNSISHEKMWRDDHLYNLVVEVGYNDDPVIPGKGSAIFLHIAPPHNKGTAGCIAFTEQDLLKILQTLMLDSYILIHS